MPYKIYKKGDGYKVCLVSSRGTCFSKEPLSREQAEKQLIALNIAHHKAKQAKEGEGEGEAESELAGGVGPGRQGMLGLDDVSKVDKEDSFQQQLKSIGIPIDDYLIVAKNCAKKAGYDPSLVNFTSARKHKLSYDSPEGLINFGQSGYGDFIIWSFLEKKGKAPKGIAEKKRADFINSHETMTKKYKLGKYSANTLALKILWSA